MIEEIDTSEVRHVYSSPSKLVGLTILSVLLAAICVWVATHDGIYDRFGTITTIVGWFGFAFFGLGAILIFTQLFKMKDAVISMSPEGLFDRRISADTIPWAVVQSLGTFDVMGTEMLVVSVDPEFENNMNLSRSARMSRKANANLGADGLVVTTQGTKIKHKTLVSWAMAYADTHGSN